MAVAASLNVVIAANTQALTSGLNKAKGSISGFSASITQISQPLISFASLATAAFGAFGRAQLNSIEGVGRMADRLGISTEALSQLQFAARMSDVEVENFNVSLSKMAINISKAATEGGPAADALREMGLSAKQLSGMNVKEQFVAITSAMDKIQGNGDKLRLAVELFGKAGQPMLDVMRGGAAELKKAANEADAFGQTISRLDVARINLVQDSFKRAWEAIKGIVNSILSRFAPALAYLATVVQAVAKVVIDFFKVWGQYIVNIGIALGAIYAVTKAIALAQKAWAAAAVLVKAAQDPKQAFAIAAAMAVAFGVVIKINNEMAKFESQLKNVEPPKFDPIELNLVLNEPDIPEALKKNKVEVAQTPAAMIRGSVEAYSAVAKLGSGGSGQRVAEEQLAVQKRLLEEFKKQKRVPLWEVGL